ncbi:Protein of uncharacterised function (DUF3164) [Sphingobacterium spiritivorum]|uniref:Protein of uncharacterized function (DUF3164) n=1 Tax=Sphingobacterium spiritivorum TaxID=258 RepID=A0A380CRY3_SPHSI|nr:DUF3164 family protein [Sphingobacterium spiritivorum]SUJ26384.1 Protein of uncharacterised function (DUF3164) [Sphingobacterium spiritivorum]
MNIENLTPEQKQALRQLLIEEDKATQQKRENDIMALKTMIDEMVTAKVPDLVSFGQKQTDIVNATFKDFEAIIQLKNELYGVKDGQASHTFTSRDGNGSICVGFNEIIAFDGTEGAGVKKIKEVIASLSSNDENREVLADLLNTFMKADKRGNLNPTRVAELVSKKETVRNPLFSEGVDIIVNAQFKTRSSMYVRGWQRIQGENGKEVKLTFSITAN